MKWGLHTKLLLSVGLIFFVVLGTNTLVYIQFLQRDYLEALAWRSEALAQPMLSDLLARLTYHTNVQGLLEAKSVQCMELYRLNKDKQVAHVAIINADGFIAAHNDKTFWNMPVPSQSLLTSLNLRKPLTVLDGEIYHTLVPIWGPQQVYVGTIDIGFPKDAVDEKVHHILLYSIGLYGLFLAVGLLAVMVLVSMLVTTPVRELMRVIQEVEQGNFDAHVQIHTKDEMGALVGTFNHLGRQLKESFHKHDQLIAELKTNNTRLQHEIAHRQQVETALAEERNLLHTLVETLPDRIYVKDAQSRFLLANEASIHSLRKNTLADLLGKTDFDLLPEELARQCYADEQALIQSAQSVIDQEEKNIDLETGIPLWFLTTKVPFRDTQGHIAGIVGISRDITDRKLAEEALQRHHDQLEELVKARTADLIVTNEHLQTEINERKQVEEKLRESQRQLQLRAQELAILNEVGQALTSCLDVESVVKEIYQGASRLIDTTNFYITRYEKNKDEITYALKVLDGQHEPLVPTQIIKKEGLTDYVITTRQPLLIQEYVAERTLELGIKYIPFRESTGQTSVCWLGVPIMMSDRVMGTMTALSYTTPQLYTEHDQDLLLALASQAAIAIENAQLFEQAQQELSERKRAEEALRVLNDELEERVQQRTAELEEALETLKKIQDQLIQSEKMALLVSLVAGIAHEINNPLGVGLLAASHLIERTQEFESSYHAGHMKRSDLESYLRISREAAQIMFTNLQLASERVQSFKNIAVDQASGDKRTFNLKPYLEEVLLSLKPKLKKIAHTVTVMCPDNIILESYPGAFSQILSNLVLNSVLHGFEAQAHGEIVLDVQRQKDALVITYHDNGKGMAQEHAERIFEAFFTTKRDQGGSGLGMNIVYNLVTKKLQGQIRCESTLGTGTTFTIQIPLPEVGNDP